MSKEPLKRKKCIECGKSILVAEYSPHSREKETTGMAAEAWDGEREDYRFVGWICNEDAWRIATTKDGGGGIAGGGAGMHFFYG